MPIIASQGSSQQYAPAPAGTHIAVACDVVDLGIMEVNFGGKSKSQHKIRIVWMLDENREDGKPILVFRRYTLSLHEKSVLRKDLEAWRGKAFTPTELEGFDVETIIGVGCMVSVVHATKDGNTFANVAAVMKLGKGMHAPQIRDYVRVVDRPKETEAIGESDGNSDMPDSWPDSELAPPF